MSMIFNQENTIFLWPTVSSMLNSVAIFSAKPCSSLLLINSLVLPLDHLDGFSVTTRAVFK